MGVIKDLAAAFGTSVPKLADMLGYTRQALYQCENSPGSKGRMAEALKSLKTDSDNRYRNDIARAELDRMTREKAIDDLADHCRLISPIDRCVELPPPVRFEDRIRALHRTGL